MVSSTGLSLPHICSPLVMVLLFPCQFSFPAVLRARLFILAKAREGSSEAGVKGGRRRRQELQAAVWMLYVLLRAPCQLLLPLPADGLALSSSQRKNIGKGIASHLEWELEHKPGTSHLNSSDRREGSGKGVPAHRTGGALRSLLTQPFPDSVTLERSRAPREGFAVVGGSAAGGSWGRFC